MASESETFTQRATHHHATPQQVQAPREELVEDELEESETEGLIGTLEIIRPSLETFVQLPLPSAQPSIIPHLSPSQGQTPLQPPTPQPSPLSEHVQMDRLWWISTRRLRDDPY